jgi:uncharacterized protein
MTQATRTRPRSASTTPGRPPGRHRTVIGAALVTGAGAAFLVGHGGSPAWQVLRVAAVAALTWLVVLVIRRATPLQRSGMLFTIGCVGVAVGVGIGLPHLAKTGVHPTTVAGLCVLLGGLVLLGFGGASLLRATPGWWRLLAAPGMVLAITLALVTLGQAVAATNVPATSVGSATPAERGLAYRDVEMQTSDGVTLAGWYVPSTNGAAVVLLHGAGSTRANVLDQAAVVAGRGFGVLLFDARGHGGSGGRAMDFGWYGDEDIAAAVSFLQEQPDVDEARIGAVGLSMGGEQAIGAAAADPRIRAVVAEGATTRVTGDRAWLSEEFGWRGAVQERVEWLTFTIADVLTAADPPIPLHDAVAAAAPRPVLLIAGGAVQDEPLAGRFIANGSPDTVQLWVVPSTGHTAALSTHRAEWDRRVTAFLTTALGPQTSPEGRP